MIFLNIIKSSLTPRSRSKVSHTFATQEEADAWLSSGKATDGELVSIAGQGFQVIQLPKGPEVPANAPAGGVGASHVRIGGSMEYLGPLPWMRSGIRSGNWITGSPE